MNIFSALLGLMALSAAAQSNIYVATNGVDDSAGGRGQSWGSPYLTISNGVAHAPTAGDTVWVSNGMYSVTTQINVTVAITVSAWSTNWLDTIVGGPYPASTSRCFYINKGGAVVKNFTVMNGYWSGGSGNGGGGVLINGGTLFNCLIISNVANMGGGVYVYNASTANQCEVKFNRTTNGAGGGVYIHGAASRVYNCLVEGNSAVDKGGGVRMGDGVMTNCTIIGNTGLKGGGIQCTIDATGGLVQGCRVSNNWSSNQGGAVEFTYGSMRDSIISSNTAASSAGGLLLYGGSSGGSIHPVVSNCVISNNVATGGGGISSGYGGGSLYDCDIANNRVPGGGGGVYSEHSASGAGVKLYNCRIHNNIANNAAGVYMKQGSIIQNCLIYNNVATSSVYGGGGGGLALVANGPLTGFVASCTIASNYTAYRGGGMIFGGNGGSRLTNLIISGNTAGDTGSDIYATGDDTNVFFYSCSSFTNFAPGQGNKTNNPMFVNLAGGNYRLSPGSPCINAGKNLDWMTNTFDLDGRPRIRDGTADMGCYEYMNPGTIFTIRGY